MPGNQLQFLSNGDGDVTAVVVPIDRRNEIASELETQHLLKSETMKNRLLQARSREDGTSLQELVTRYGSGDAEE